MHEKLVQLQRQDSLNMSKLYKEVPAIVHGSSHPLQITCPKLVTPMGDMRRLPRMSGCVDLTYNTAHQTRSGYQ